MKISVLDLRPTQIAVGIREVEEKAARIRNLKAKEVEDYLKEHWVPVVVAPSGEYYLIDHHHLIRACWESGIEKAPVEVKADFSKLKPEQFWKVMHESQWLHLFDQFGFGPHQPHQLPHDIRGLADDPYRSLAWAVREKGGYVKTDIPFCEFQWAEFLRKKIVLEPGKDRFAAALKEALVLSRSAHAQSLPGFLESAAVKHEKA